MDKADRDDATAASSFQQQHSKDANRPAPFWLHCAGLSFGTYDLAIVSREAEHCRCQSRRDGEA
jgi:hypothetical protein